MNFNYQNYVERYNYEPYCWPPDIGLAELHARCSEPGPESETGVKCPCCDHRSKRKVRKWWKRSIQEDFQEFGSAVPGYFMLLKYYAFFCVCVLMVNSLYPIYATYYACNNLEEAKKECLSVGLFYYLNFNTLIQLLEDNNNHHMVDVLEILQTTVFYILLTANYFSIFFVTFHNDSVKHQLKQSRMTQNKFDKCLIFYNVSPEIASNFKVLPQKKDESENLSIVRILDLYEIKKYFKMFKERNQIYYHLLSAFVQGEDPFRAKKLNKKLKQTNQQLLKEKENIGKYIGKIMVLFQDVESKKQMHRLYRISAWKKWYYGLRTILHQLKICDFDAKKMELCSFEVEGSSDLRWENIGEPMGAKMATRIKTFFVALVFIVICYFVLAYPILFSLKTHIKEQTSRFNHLNTFEQILPDIIALLLVTIMIAFRNYMDKLSEERNPKDEVEKAKFVLLSVITFHIVFYVLIPTFFFMYPNELSPTVKLYVIAQQARAFIVIQIIFVIIDLPYRMWKNRKIQALSDQRYAFRYNQQMLHKIVQSRDYPLEIRLQVLFRVWSLVQFYAFFLPYMVFYIALTLLIFYWNQKKNLFKHYSLHRKISIKLESEVLITFVNFFCIYLCFIYCFNVNSYAKIIVAICITLAGLVANIVYWIVLNKAEEGQAEALKKMMEQEYRKEKRSDSQDLSDVEKKLSSKTVGLLRRSFSEQEADQFQETYYRFLASIKNEELDQEIIEYLEKFEKKESDDSKRRKGSSLLIELPGYGQSETEQSEREPEPINLY